MKFPNSFYAIGNLKKKRLGIRYISTPRPQANESADHLQTVGDPVVRFFAVSLEVFRGRNGGF